MLICPGDPAAEPALEDATDEDNAIYILHFIKKGPDGKPMIARNVWFDRLDLTIVRQKVFDPSGSGAIVSDTRYSKWQTYNGVMFPAHIDINRDEDGYGLVLDVTEMKMNIDLGDPRSSCSPSPPDPHSRRSERRNRVAFRLVWENVKFRPVRTLLSVLLIAVPVMLILTLVGLSAGFFEDSARRAKGVGADILFRPPGTALLGSLGGAPLPEKMVDHLARSRTSWPQRASPCNSSAAASIRSPASIPCRLPA